MDEFGKLKRTLSEKCPECGHRLEIRMRDISGMINGVPIISSEEYIVCSDENCFYERDSKKRGNKFIKEDFYKQKTIKKNGKNGYRDS